MSFHALSTFAPVTLLTLAALTSSLPFDDEPELFDFAVVAGFDAGLFDVGFCALCAVLGSAILGIQRQYDFLLATFYGFTAGLSFMFAIVLFSGIRERIELCNIPKPFRGFPIALIAASLLSIAFTGFSGLKIF